MGIRAVQLAAARRDDPAVSGFGHDERAFPAFPKGFRLPQRGPQVGRGLRRAMERLAGALRVHPGHERRERTQVARVGGADGGGCHRTKQKIRLLTPGRKAGHRLPGAKRIRGMSGDVPPNPTIRAADLAAAELPPAFVAASREKFARFVDAARKTGETPLVLCHSDADGLAAGAILTIVLRRAGLADVEVLATGKGGSAWSDETAALLAARRPGALIVTDLGVRDDPVRDGPPPLFIDHHRPSGLPPSADETVITGYGVDPTPTSGLLALACAGGLAGVDSDDLDWIAAVSALSDLGDKAPFAIIAAAKKRYGAGMLRDTVTLLKRTAPFRQWRWVGRARTTARRHGPARHRQRQWSPRRIIAPGQRGGQRRL